MRTNQLEGRGQHPHTVFVANHPFKLLLHPSDSEDGKDDRGPAYRPLSLRTRSASP